MAVRTAEVWCGDIPNEQLGTRRSPMSFAGSMRLLITERGRRRKAAGCVAVRRAGRRPAAGVELKRSVDWSAATSAVGVPGFRAHDLRHTAASVWLAADGEPKVVQWVLGHATAAMTMDLHGHMMIADLRQATPACPRSHGSYLAP